MAIRDNMLALPFSSVPAGNLSQERALMVGVPMILIAKEPVAQGS